MQLIKLPAIDSTNDFLKELSKNQLLENFTTVIAEEQTNGRGQMGSGWVSEKGKNLIMSVLIRDVVAETDQVFALNIAISLSVIEVLEALKIPNPSIKWPNDILSDDKKIAGILIENRFKSDSAIESIVGVGLNVNQQEFSGLPQASSLALIAGKEFDLEALYEQLLLRIQRNCSLITGGFTEKLWNSYHHNLFRKDVAMQFETPDKNIFTGTITGVTKEGRLEVLPGDGARQTYGIKELKLLY